MDSGSPAATEEMKQFLQDGLRNYAPALVAVSEFRRQVRSRLQAVFDEFSADLSGLGLSASELRPVAAKLDGPSLDERSSSVELERNYPELSIGCYLKWDLRASTDKQVWVGAYIYLKLRADRDRLYAELKKQPSESKTVLFQSSARSSHLLAYVDADAFQAFDETFRALVEEWMRLLSSDGIRRFLPPVKES